MTHGLPLWHRPGPPVPQSSEGGVVGLLRHLAVLAVTMGPPPDQTDECRIQGRLRNESEKKSGLIDASRTRTQGAAAEPSRPSRPNLVEWV
jgi:hypothetical protein